MLKLDLHIEDINCLSPQNTFTNDFPGNSIIDHVRICNAIEPDYEKIIPPNQLRRMSRLFKMAQTCALSLIERNPNCTPESIICSSGKGSLSDTETFLYEIDKYQEGALNPGPFIQSTYNAINGGIAIQKKINGYSNMFVHRGLSLQSALLDAAVRLNENPEINVLCGGFDEITEENFKIKQQLGFWKEEKESLLNIEHSKTKGTHAGEGASFLLLNKKNGGVKIKYLHTFFHPDLRTLNLKWKEFQKEFSLQPELLISGYNGDIRYADLHHEFYKQNFSSTPKIYYKKYCGDYETAIGFAIYLASQILKDKNTLEKLIPNSPNEIKRILIHNSFLEKNHSFLWIEKE